MSARNVVNSGRMRILILFLMVAGACTRTETSEPDNQTPEPTVEEAAKSGEEAAPDDQPPEPFAGEEEPQAGDDSAVEIDLDAPPTVELLDAGKAPHKALRTTFEVGAKQSLRVESDWTVSTIYGPMIAMEAVMPSLVYELDTEVQETSAERTRFALRVKKVSVEAGEKAKPAQVKAVKKSVGALEGAKGSFSVDARGLVETFALDAPVADSLIVHDMVDQIELAVRAFEPSPPRRARGQRGDLDREPGHRPAHRANPPNDDLRARQREGRATRSDERTHEAAAPEQNIKMPGSHSGASFQLNKFELLGRGQGHLATRSPRPVFGNGETLAAFYMTARKPKRETVVMGVNTMLEIKAKP